jgi:hypothetical protein
MGNANVKVLYIGGYGRSGSTLLERVLAQIDGFVFLENGRGEPTCLPSCHKLREPGGSTTQLPEKENSLCVY